VIQGRRSSLGKHARVAHAIVYTVPNSLETPINIEQGESKGFYAEAQKNRLHALGRLLETLQRQLRPSYGMRLA
jgi:hypothetical protein